MVKILNEFIGKTLEDYLGKEIAASAEKHIDALNDAIKTSVKSKIAAHTKVFESKTKADQQKLKQDAHITVKNLPLGVVSCDCPSCSGKALLRGELIKELEPTYSDGELLAEHIFLASEFKCLVCDLKLKGLEELVQAEIEPQFTEMVSTSLHDLYEPDQFYEYNNM